MTQHLHISLGPVQGFVAQARRTRDLWGGSYLLSLLSAHAMASVRAAGGRIIRPLVEGDPLLRWVEHRDTPGEAPPRLGSLPNQFTCELRDDLDPALVANAARHAFEAAWKRICDEVWRRDLAELAPRLGRDTEAIWRRQIEQFFELVWVAGDADDHGVLDRRKRWRTHRLPEEGGDKCTVMPELQELSGYHRATERAQQDALWDALRDRLGPRELRPRERLCAVAFVKRRYAHVLRHVLGRMVDVKQWPSTIDVAAVPWIQRAAAIAAPALDAYAEAVQRHAAEDPVTGGASRLVPDALRRAAPHAVALGANWFHASFVANPGLAVLRDDASRKPLCDQLRALARLADGDDGPLGLPPIYYALLLADGDRLGELVKQLGGEPVSRALAGFTEAVAGIVEAHHGVTVYAGGDDVLALLPIRRALDCAQDLEQRFRQAFAGAPATLSAAVVFAHARAPLGRVLAEAHRLLDEVAKDGNGRASLAAGVYRGETMAVQWVTTWERPVANGGRRPATACIQDAMREMRPSGGRLSSSLIHDLRRILGLLCGDASTTPGSFATLPDGVDITALVKAEILHRLDRGDGDAPELALLTATVDALLGRSRRRPDRSSDNQPDGVDPDEPRQLGIDGLVLASFLANDGREEEHQP
jgi:CRISPR-associated protein Cmr2